MALFRSSGDFDKVAKGNPGADRRRIAEAEGARRKAGQDGAGAAEAVLQVMTVLPSLMMSSRQAEVERLTAIDPAHPRLARIQQSAEALARLAPVARRLRARGARGLAIARAPVAGLHGFVEDGAGRPLGGLIVTLKGADGPAPNATTADDGYFVLTITKGADGQRPEAEQARPVHVAILDKAGRILHEDPIPLDASIGVGYRDYVIDRQRDIPTDKQQRGRRSRPSGPKR
jgi:hypothetical protein